MLGTALRRSVVLIICITLILIVAGQGAAPPMPYMVAGVITDDHGTSIPGAEVNVTNLDSGGWNITFSDNAGRYVVDLFVFPNGYLNGDRLSVSARLGSLSGIATGVVNTSQAMSYVNVTIADSTPPVIFHTPITTASACEPIAVSCVVEDDMRVAVVALSYIGVEGSGIVVLEMELKQGNRINGTWGASIPTQGSTGPLRYWITAVDLSGNSASTPVHEVDVVHGDMHSFAIEAPIFTEAGAAFQIGIRAVDACGNAVLNYTGTVILSSTDPHPAVLPAPYTFTSDDAGSRLFSGLVLYTAHSQEIIVTDPSMGISASVAVGVDPAPAARMAWLPSSVSLLAGTWHPFTIYPVDPYENPATYPYELDILLSTTSAEGAFDPPSLHMEPRAPSAITLYSDTDVQGSPHTLTAQPTDPEIAKRTAEVWVLNAGSAQRWQLSPAEQQMSAGEMITLNLSLLDPWDNPVPVDAETVVTLSTTSPSGTFLSLDDTPISSAALHPGNWSAAIRYTDRTASLVPHILLASNGTHVAAGTARITVSPSTIAAIRLGTPNSTTAGAEFNATVCLYDRFGNRVWNFNGSLGIEADDPLFEPMEYRFTAADLGFHNFVVVLYSAGSREIAARVEGLSTSSFLSVVHAPLSNLRMTAPPGVEAGAPFTFGVSALDPYDNRVRAYNGTVTFTSTDLYPAVLPEPYTFSSSDEGIHLFERGAVLYTIPQQRIEVSDPNEVSNTTIIFVNDTSPPRVNVSCPAEAEAGSTVQIVIEASDTVRIAGVWVEYAFDDRAWMSLATVQVSGNRSTGVGQYASTIHSPDDAARLRFRVVASDGANSVRQPLDGEYEVPLVPPVLHPSYLWLVPLVLLTILLLAVLYRWHRRRK